MARPLRPEYAGAVYYVSSVGNRGQSVFQSSADGNAWIEILKGVCERFGCRCLGYCLMSDGYHLVLETPKPNLSKAIRQLNGVYTQRSNRLHDTDGHVFRGRYKSIVVQREKYLLPLMADIFLLPLRAGFVKHSSQFKWSSCRYLYGKDEAPGYMDLDWFSEGFSSDTGGFDEFLRENLERDVVSETRKQIYLGDDEFIELVQEKAKMDSRSRDIPRYQTTKPAIKRDKRLRAKRTLKGGGDSEDLPDGGLHAEGCRRRGLRSLLGRKQDRKRIRKEVSRPRQKRVQPNFRSEPKQPMKTLTGPRSINADYPKPAPQVDISVKSPAPAIPARTVLTPLGQKQSSAHGRGRSRTGVGGGERRKSVPALSRYHFGSERSTR